MTFRKRHLLAALVLLLLFFQKTYGQPTVTTNFNYYSICDINFETGQNENCSEKKGQLFFKKAEVIPNKSVVLFFKESSQEKDIESIKNYWDFSKLSMNNDESLFIYKLIKGDLNVDGQFTIYLLLNLDYSIHSLKYILNQNDKLLEITLQEK